MLAGCSSSTLLSPRHRLRSEAPAQFQACYFQTSMSTQRLDLPCSFSRKDTSRSQPIRPVGLSVEKPIESKTSGCSLKQNIRLPPLTKKTREENILYHSTTLDTCMAQVGRDKALAGSLSGKEMPSNNGGNSEAEAEPARAKARTDPTVPKMGFGFQIKPGTDSFLVSGLIF